MNVLAIDTSGNHLTVALIGDNGVVCEFIGDLKLQHSTSLMPNIEKLLLKSGVSLKDIDVYACVVGPGSFTGIRIGVSTMKALAYANKKRVLKITSFDVLAYNKENGKNLAVIDARHNNYYVCGFKGLQVVLPPSFINGEQLKQLEKEYDLLTANDIDYVNANCDLKQGLINAVKEKLKESSLDVETLVPLYVRKSQAEENL